jgi:hypothetical protein
MRPAVTPAHYNDTKETVTGYAIYCLVIAVCIVLFI